MVNSRNLKAIIISCGCWSLLMMGHEIIGHGLMTLLVGGKAIGVNGMYFEHDLSMVSDLGIKWVQAGGSLFNILLGFISLFILNNSRNLKYWTYYFLWCTAVLNIIHAGSYIGFARFIHDGMDWVMVLKGAEHYSFWMNMETIIGLLLIVLGALLIFKLGKQLITKHTNYRRLYWTPLFSSLTLSVISSFLVPDDNRIMMVMGGVGNGFVFLIPLLILGFLRPKTVPANYSFNSGKNPYFILVFSCICTITYIFFVSPGLKF